MLWHRVFFRCFPFLKSILCEWDILAQYGQEVYVWVACGSSKGDNSRPAVIHLGADGSVDTVVVPKRGSPSDIDRMFPKEAQMKFQLLHRKLYIWRKTKRDV